MTGSCACVLALAWQTPAAAPKKEESGVLMVMNLPDSLTDEYVRELLRPFGELKRFNLLKVCVFVCVSD